MKEFYGDIPTSKLRLIRSLGANELAQWKSTESGQIKLTAQANSQKGVAGHWLEELGFVGKELNSRNTIHFTLNCAVEDHAYGSFEKDVLFVFPFDSVVSQKRPSGFSEVDVVFPFTDGLLELPIPRIFVREGCAVPEQWKGVVQTFPKDEGHQDVIKRCLEQEGCPVKQASFHGWSEGSQTLSSSAELFVEELGGETILGSHANSDEGQCEWALGAFSASVRQLFFGNDTYENDLGRTESHDSKAMYAMKEVERVSTDARHPATQAYATVIKTKMDEVHQRALKVQAEWARIKENPTSEPSALLSQVPASCKESVLSRLVELRMAAKLTESFASMPWQASLDDRRFVPTSAPHYIRPPTISKPSLPTPHMKM